MRRVADDQGPGFEEVHGGKRVIDGPVGDAVCFLQDVEE